MPSITTTTSIGHHAGFGGCSIGMKNTHL